jgi:hypothetical protein
LGDAAKLGNKPIQSLPDGLKRVLLWRVGLTNSSSVVEARVKDNQVGAPSATLLRASRKHLLDSVAADAEVEHTVAYDIRGLVPAA